MTPGPVLEAQHLSRRFGAQLALDDVDLSVSPGQVHALVGENGAGKSTLIKLLSGVYAPTGGTLRVGGRPAVFTGPADAQRAGIRVLHQERQLVPDFSVLENLYLGADIPTRGGRVDWNAMRREATRLQAELDLDLPLEELARHLTPTQRTLTEVLRAVRVRCRLLILDEPTASLSHQDAVVLYRLIRRLSAEDTAILYISHRLEEVFDLADEITVLRGGRVAARFRRGGVDADGLIAAMSGPGAGLDHERQADLTHRPGQPVHAPPLLQVRQLATHNRRVRDVSLTLHRGEVLGIYGLAGSGRTELLETLAGLRRRLRGSVSWAADAVASRVLIPEDRRGQGLVAHLSVCENLTLTTLGLHTSWGMVNAGSERRAVQDATRSLDIRAAGPAQPINELSGGNQQKVIFARALAERPQVWLCDEPTQAVDVMTRRAIHGLLRAQAASGAGVLFVTSDLAELLEVADRVVVLREGRSVAALTGEDLSAGAVLQACYGPAPAGAEPSHAAR